jgi:hypothetical protein
VNKTNDIKHYLKNNPEALEEIKGLLKEPDSEEKESKKSQSDVLMDLCNSMGFELFHDENKEGYARIIQNNHLEIHKILSRQFKLWLKHRAYVELNKFMPNDDSVKKVLDSLEGEAIFNGREYVLHNRSAAINGVIWYDLTNLQWQVIKITSADWELESNTPVIFKRYSHQASQVIPLKQGNIKKILDYINIKDNQKLLFLVYLVSLFIPSIPHVIAVLFGERGAAKTTTSKTIKKLVDPSSIDTFTFPKDINELVQKLSHHWVLPFDNITGLQDYQSDSLCRAVTGEGLSKRKLYTDDEDIIYNFKRCIILNGINVVATREDLLDRCILFELERIPTDKRKEELKYWQEFEKDKSIILGGIFNTLSKAMALYPKVKLEKLYRMADFTRWGYAIAEALEEGTGEKFLKAYTENIERQNEEALNSNPLAVTIISFMKDKTEWEGTAANLLSLIKDVALREQIDTKSKSFPQAPNYLTRYLNRLKTNLKDAGILYDHGYDKRKNVTHITLSRISENISDISVYPKPLSNACYDSEIQTDISPLLSPPIQASKINICGCTGDTGDKNTILTDKPWWEQAEEVLKNESN